jgi:uncharacterized RDD family membrane protein YckC
MNTQYAGFWLRFVAAIIDGIILGVVQWLIILPILGVMGIGMASEFQNIQPGNEAESLSMVAGLMAVMGLAQLFFFVLQTLYFSFMESSNLQASVGKLALGLKVTDTNDAKLSFGKALIRNVSKFISMMTMFIGYIIAGFTEKKQALHDLIGGTLVVRK